MGYSEGIGTEWTQFRRALRVFCSCRLFNCPERAYNSNLSESGVPSFHPRFIHREWRGPCRRVPERCQRESLFHVKRALRLDLVRSPCCPRQADRAFVEFGWLIAELLTLLQVGIGMRDRFAKGVDLGTGSGSARSGPTIAYVVTSARFRLPLSHNWQQKLALCRLPGRAPGDHLPGTRPVACPRSVRIC